MLLRPCGLLETRLGDTKHSRNIWRHINQVHDLRKFKMVTPVKRRLVQTGMKHAVKAFHLLGNGCKTDLDPAIKEAFKELDICILDLKESLGFERNGDWIKKEET
jgi:hypothetical protein